MIDMERFLKGIPVNEARETIGEELRKQFQPDLEDPKVRKQIGLARLGIASTIRGGELEVHADKAPRASEIEASFEEYLAWTEEPTEEEKLKQELDDLKNEVAELKKNRP